MEKILITEPIHPDAVAFLKTRFDVVQGAGRPVAEEGADCAAVLLRSAKVSAADMARMPKLRVIGKHGIGLDNIDVAAATERGIAVVNAPFANVNAVAEHTVALLLALTKHMVLLDGVTRGGGFTRRNDYTNVELTGKRVGLVGLGRIARLVAEKLKGFGVELVGSDPFVTEEACGRLGIQLLSLEEVLRTSDFVSLHTPLTAETHHLMNARRLGWMKRGAYLVNASRGSVVEEGALCEALKSGALAGAGLDVFEEEPPMEGHPLFSLDNVVLSPHNAALTDAALAAMAEDSAHGIADWLEGRRPEYLCNPAVWIG